MVPGSDAALDAAECKAATAFLAELTGGVGVLETAQAQAALVALLALITSEGHKDLLHDLRNPGDDNHLVSLNDRWYIRRIIPNGEEHARAERRAGSESFRFLLPLPEQLLAELNAIRGAPNQLIAWGLFEDEEKKLLRRLRSEVTPRYTEGRARLALPSDIFSRTEDPTRAQLLTGSSLGQSDGGLAYYGQPYREITEHWRDELRDVFGLDVRLDDAIPDRWIGAPLAAVRDEQIATLVRLYQQPVEAALQVGDPVAIHDALAIYLCRKFQALTGHRGFKSIGKVLLVDVLLAGACSTEDKPRDSSPGRRLAIIGVNYVRELQQLVRLRHHIANKESEVTPGLRDQCTLQGHVFWLIAEGRRVKRSDIAPPRETCLPVNVFRSRLRMQLTRRGVKPRYIFGQLGHIWNGEAPFSFHTTESVIEVIDRLGPVLEQILKDDGWKVFSVPTRLVAPQKTAPWPMPCLVENFGKVEAWSFGDSETTSRVRRRFPVEQKQEHLEWVVGSLRKLYARYPTVEPVSSVPDCSEKDRFGLSVNLRERSSAPNKAEFVPRNVVLTVSDVEDLIRQLIIEGEGSPARVGACLRMLRARVIWNRRRFAWSGVLPPLAIEPEPVIQAISRVHVAAANLASKIRERIVSLESLGGSDKVHARWCRLIVLLVLDHALFDEAQLKDAIDTLSTLEVPIPDHGAYAGIVELRFGQAVRAVRLSSEALLLANSVRGTTSAGLSEIKRRLANDLGDSLGAGVIRALLSVADRAARINLPGLDWICVERGDPGTLDLERTRDLLEGRCGGETRQCNSAGPEDEVRIQARLSQHRASLPSQRHMQYKKLRRELNDLREPGAGRQGVPRWRFARARELLVTTIRDPAADRLVAMLASYAFMFVGGGKSERTRISTGYGAMTTIGLRLLRALGSRALEDCSITDLFLGVIAGTGREMRPSVALALKRFHNLHRDGLGEADMGAVFRAAGRQNQHPSLVVEIVTDGELRACCTIYQRAAQTGQISALGYHQRCFVQIAMQYMGLRAGETTHGEWSDVYASRLYVRNNESGRVKTAASRRVVSINDDTPGLAQHLGMLREHYEQSLRTERRNVIVDAGGDSGLTGLLEDVRQTLAQVSGGRATSLHSHRHAALSREILKARCSAESYPDPAVSVMAVSCRAGQASPSVGHQSYFHLRHLLPRVEQAINSVSQQALTGVLASTVRQRKRRVEASDAIGSSPVQRVGTMEVTTFPLPSAAARLDVNAALHFLARIHAGEPIHIAMAAVGLSREATRNLVEGLRDIGLRFGLLLMPEHALSGAVAVGLEVARPAGNSRTLKLLQRDIRALRSMDLKDLGKEFDPVGILTAYRRFPEQLTADERAAWDTLLGKLKDATKRTISCNVATLVAGVVSAYGKRALIS